MALSSLQWASLLHLTPHHFKYPQNMGVAIVRSLDNFISIVNAMPEILSDYRPGDTGQHGNGLAVDCFFNGLDPLYINTQAIESGLFTGVGLYVNDLDVASHHFDRRPDRTVDAPATWGGFISHPYVSESNSHVKKHVKKIDYVAMGDVADFLKKKEVGAGIVLIGLGYVLYRMIRS